MQEMEGGISCNGFQFFNDFDSANLAKVVSLSPAESVISATSKQDLPDYEFNLWTKPDCCGTEFENGNRTWFYFGIRAPVPNLTVRLNLVDLNRQGKMYSQGMAPVYRILPGKPTWERIRDKPIHNTIDDVFTLSFKYKSPENSQSVTYFAFTYPYSYSDLLKYLSQIDHRFLTYTANYEDDIYYYKETLSKSLNGRDICLLTISSYHFITPELEIRLKNLFPEKNQPRPFKFINKKIIFISARVHPGETPSSFVFNGFLNLLLSDDPIAIQLRRLYVFKLIPFLNPDGVALGHYRTDTRGVNLNRVYLNPNFQQHPSVYAARALLRYYHYGFEKKDEQIEIIQGDTNISMKVSNMSLEETNSNNWCLKCKNFIVDRNLQKICTVCRKCTKLDETHQNDEIVESGLFLYLDLHGHASKKGIFMYGNHFDDLEKNVECMLLPKLMSLNNHNFHYTACNFTERNMYLRDRRDGMSREGSGRVAALKMTGLIKSYTLECNYNTGRIVNVLPPTIKEQNNKVHTILVPPKYSPQVFEEVGRSLGASILDLTGQNPHTRLPNSEFHSLAGLKDWLRINCAKDMDEVVRPIKAKIHSAGLQHTQGNNLKTRPVTSKLPKRPSTVPIERKENLTSLPERSNFRTTSKIKKKEVMSKFKRVSSEKKIVRNKMKKTKELSEQDRLKLREIVLMKTNDKEEMWKVASSSSKKDEATTSTYLASFAKNSNFNKCKFKKHTLRRLTKSSSDTLVKVEKVKKRKKLKK